MTQDTRSIGRIVFTITLVLAVVFAGITPFTSLSGPTSIASAGHGGTDVDDFEDGDINVETTGWTGWAGDTGQFANTTNAINGSYSGKLSSDGSGGSNFNINADSSSDLTPSRVAFRMNKTAERVYFQVENGTTPVINFRVNADGGVEVRESGTWTSAGVSLSNNADHAVELKNIDYANDTFVLFINGYDRGTYSFDSSDSVINSLNPAIDSSSAGHVKLDDVELDGSDYTFPPEDPSFADSFDNETADAGVPEQFDAVTDPRGAGFSRNADVEEVQTDVTYEGGQAYYAEESLSSNSISIRPNVQPYDRYHTENVSIVMNRPDKKTDGSDATSGNVNLGIYTDTGQNPNIQIIHKSDALKYRNSAGNMVNITTKVDYNEWVRAKVYNIDTQNNTYSVYWRDGNGNTGTAHNLEMWNPMDYGYKHTIGTVDGAGYVDSMSVATEGVQLSENKEISGRVTDTDGNGVANATYEIVGVDYSNITTDADQTKAERADELLDQDTSAIPDSYDSELNIGGSDGFGANAACEYVAINSRNEWGLEKWTTGVDVGSPTVNPASKRELVFSVWDPTYASGPTTFRDDADADNPGKTVNRDVKIERLDPLGDDLKSNTITLDERRKVGVGPTAKEHAIGTRALPQGAYRIQAEGCGVGAYTIVVGSEGDIIESFESQMNDSTGVPSEAAEQAQERLDSGKYVRITGTTDENGYYSENISNGNVERVAVTAYRIDGKTLTELNDPSPKDMRAYVKNNDYNGSIAFSLEPRRYDVPNENADVTVRKFSSPPYASLDDFASSWGMMRDKLENGVFNGTGSIYSIPLDQWNKDQKEDGAKNLTKILDENPELVDEWEDSRGEDYDDFKQQLEDSERTNEQLRDDIREMENLIDSRLDDLESEEPESSTDPVDQTVDYRQAFDGDFGEDDVVAVWKDFNGDSEPISGEYLSVNKRPGQGDEVVVDDYPIPNESAGGYVSVTVASEDGKIGSGGDRVENPNFDGTIPELRSIDATTLQPGPNERVSLEPRFEQGANVTGVSVRDEAGNPVSASLSSGEVTFTPTTSGTHFARITYKAPDGSGPFVESVRMPVGETSHAWPPGVYVRDGRSGVFTVAGQSVDDARTTVSSSGTKLDVTVLVERDSGTNEVHYHLEDAPQSTDQDVTLRVIEGDSIDTGTSISRHVGAYIHGRSISENAVMYRADSGVSGGETPIPHDGETNAGGLGTGTKGGTVIQTYTGANGETTVEINNDPNRRDRFWYGVSVRWEQRGGILGMMAPAPVVDVSSTVGTLPAWSVISLEPAAPTSSTGALVDATVGGPIQNAGAGVAGAIA